MRGGFSFMHKDLWAWKPFSLSIHFLVESVWRLTFGLRPTLLYLMHVRKVTNDKLRRDGLEIVNKNENFIQFSNELSGRISEELVVSEIERLKSDTSLTKFTTDLTKVLDKDTRMRLLEFALRTDNVETVSGYLKFVPKLESIQVMLNIPTGKPPVGSQRWHRDWFVFKGMNLFMALTEVDHVTGRYSAIGLTAIPRRAEIPVRQSDQALHPYDRDRVSDALMSDFVCSDSIELLEGAAGTTAFVDSGWVYHKGGHVTERHRIMLQIAYRAPERPWAAAPVNILADLGLADDALVDSILQNKVSRYMVSNYNFWPVFGAVFHKLARLLTYYSAKLTH